MKDVFTIKILEDAIKRELEEPQKPFVMIVPRQWQEAIEATMGIRPDIVYMEKPE